MVIDQDLSISEEDRLFDSDGVPVDGVTPVVDHLGTALSPDDSKDRMPSTTHPGRV